VKFTPAESIRRLTHLRGSSRYLLLSLAALVLASTLLPAPAYAGPDEDFGFAVALYRKSRWEQAATRFREFLRQNPRHPRAEYAQLYYGLSLVNLDKFKEAHGVLEDFVSRYPNSRNLPDAMYRLGEASYYLGNYREAEDELGRFLERYPKHSLREWALPYLGDTRLRLGQAEAAEELFRTALKQFPDSSLSDEATFGLARALERQSKNAEAAKAYEELIEAKAGAYLDDALLNLGSLRFAAGDYQAASELFDRVVAIKPESSLRAAALLNAGFAHYRSGDFAKAIDRFEAVPDSSDSKPTARYWIGLSLERQQKPDEAAAVYQSIAETAIDKELRAESLYRWGQIAYRSGDYEKAGDVLARAVTTLPEGPRAEDSLFFAAQAALFAGNLSKAESLSEQYAEDYPEGEYRGENRILIGRILEASADKKGVPDDRVEQLRREALTTYAEAAQTSTAPATRMKAHYYRASLAEQVRAADIVISSAEAIRDGLRTLDARDAQAFEQLANAYVVAARVSVGAKEWQRAGEFASAYLEAAPKGEQVDGALAAKAIALMATERTDEAVDTWRKLRNEYPDSDVLPGATEDMAERAYALAKYDAAAELFSAAAKLAEEPKQAQLLSGAGWSHFQQGRFDEAAEAFTTSAAAAELTPAVAIESAYMKARALEEAKRTEDAIDAYRVAFQAYRPEEPADENFEKDAPLRNVYLSGLQLARTLRTAGKVEESAKAYEAVVESFPTARNLDRLLDEWALLHYEAGEYDKSDNIFARLVKARPDSPVADNAKLSLAESDLAAGKTEDAVEKLRELATSENSDEGVKRRSLFLLVGIAGQQRDWKNVRQRGEQYLSAFPNAGDRTAVAYQLGEALVQLGEYDEAATVLKSVRETPEDDATRETEWFPRTWVLSAEVARQRGDVEQVQKFADELRAFDPTPRIIYQVDQIVGQALLRKAKFDEARQAFQRVLDNADAKLTETAARAQYGIAQSYFLQEKWQEAWDAAFRAYSIYDLPEVQAPSLLMAARCDEALGNTDAAREFYNSVVKEFPETDFAAEAAKRLAEMNDPSGS